jgi:hypothetical protein
MFCPMEYWSLNTGGPNPKRYRLRRAFAELLSSFSVLSWLGQMIIIPPDWPAGEDEPAGSQPVHRPGLRAACGPS